MACRHHTHDTNKKITNNKNKNKQKKTTVHSERVSSTNLENGSTLDDVEVEECAEQTRQAGEHHPHLSLMMRETQRHRAEVGDPQREIKGDNHDQHHHRLEIQRWRSQPEYLRNIFSQLHSITNPTTQIKNTEEKETKNQRTRNTCITLTTDLSLMASRVTRLIFFQCFEDMDTADAEAEGEAGEWNSGGRVLEEAAFKTEDAAAEAVSSTRRDTEPTPIPTPDTAPATPASWLSRELWTGTVAGIEAEGEVGAACTLLRCCGGCKQV